MSFYKRSLRVLLSSCVLSASIVSPSLSQSDDLPTMSLNTMIMFALDNNPDLMMAGARVDQMESYVKEAQADLLPRVELDVTGGRQYVTPASGQTTNNFGKSTLRMSQALFDGYATESEIERRRLVKEATEIEKSAQTDTVILQTIRYYLDVLRFQAEVKTYQKFNAEMDKIMKTINDMYSAGAVSKVMNDYALSRHASARLDLSNAMSSWNDAISNLEYLTGPLPEFAAELPDNFKPEGYEFDYYYDIADDDNQVIVQNRKEIEALRHKLNYEKAAYYPDVDLNVSAEHKSNDGGDVGMGRDIKAYVSMNYEIFDGFLRKNKTDRIGSEIKELQFKDERLKKELKRNLKLSYNQILAAQTSIRAVNAEIKNSTMVKLLNTENFRLGNINAIELIEGEERLKDSYVKRHKLQRDLYLNKYSLLINSTLLNGDYFCASCENM